MRRWRPRIHSQCRPTAQARSSCPIIGQLIASILYVIANIYVGRDHFILCRLVLEDYAVCS